MRILIVVHGYPPSFMGGAELRAERTARGLAARGHEVAVLCIESMNAPEHRLVIGERLQDGVHVHQLYVQTLAALGDGYERYESDATQNALAELIGQWHPDIVHLFSGYLMGTGVIDVSVEHQVPVVVSLTDYWWLCHRINLVRTDGTRCNGPSPVGCARCHRERYRRYRLPSTVARPLADGLWELAGRIPLLGEHFGVDRQSERLPTMLATLEKASALIAPSQFLAKTYMRHGLNHPQLHVWRQGVSLNACPLRTPSPMLRFGYFGQIKHHKGVHTLIAAWEQLKSELPRSLEIFGSAHGEEGYATRLQQITRQMAAVTWHEAIPHAHVWQKLAEIDVLIIPSRWFENSPNVILEAQAMGVVMIGTNLGGIAELIEHEANGLLFAADDAADLAQQMQRLLDEKDLLPRLQRHPIAFRSFSDELDQIEGLYLGLVLEAPDENSSSGRASLDSDQQETLVEMDDYVG